MRPPADRNDWVPEQQARLTESPCPRSCDVHCHCLPGIDDGPATMDDALALCDALTRDGLTTVVATPHQFGPYDRDNTATKIRGLVADLRSELETAGIPLEVLPGADVRIDERLLRLIDEDEVVTVGDRKAHLLLELPHEYFLDPTPLFAPLRERGIQPVLTHPERHRYLRREQALIESWVDQGVIVQVTAGSLVGHFGEGAFRFAWDLVTWGLAHVVATDAHGAERRCPTMSKAIHSLSQQAPSWLVDRICLINPWLIVCGQHLVEGPISEE